MTEMTSDIDLYDSDVRRIGQVAAAINTRFANKVRATRQTLDEYERVAKDYFHQAGFVVLIDTSEALLSIGYPKVSIVGRVEGSDDEKYGHDHERHKFEIDQSINTGQDKHMRSAFKKMYEDEA